MVSGCFVHLIYYFGCLIFVIPNNLAQCAFPLGRGNPAPTIVNLQWGRGGPARTIIGDYDYAVDVVGHDDKYVQLNIFKMIEDFAPEIVHDFAYTGQFHRFIYYLSKNTFFVIGTNGYKIPAITGIIVFL